MKSGVQPLDRMGLKVGMAFRGRTVGAALVDVSAADNLCVGRFGQNDLGVRAFFAQHAAPTPETVPPVP